MTYHPREAEGIGNSLAVDRCGLLGALLTRGRQGSTKQAIPLAHDARRCIGRAAIQTPEALEQRNKAMKHPEKPATSSSSGSPVATSVANKNRPKKPAQDEPRAGDDSAHKIDRPGLDLGGSSDDTHAGTGLGPGDDAFDTPGDRRLPGRRPDNKLTIPHWGGPEPRGSAVPVKKPSGRETPSAPKTKSGR